jgi:hypothetical protein
MRGEQEKNSGRLRKGTAAIEEQKEKATTPVGV